MDALNALVGIYRSTDPTGAVEALMKGLGERVPARCVVWVQEDEAAPVCGYPEDVLLPPELLTIAGHLSRPEVFPIDTLSPVGAARFPKSDMLVLPLARSGSRSGAVVLVADSGTFGETALGEEWQEITEALEAVDDRYRSLTEARSECMDLRKRTREMEALDVLGLAVNRTLDPREVLTLVARFTRTLLGAHYAVVYTKENESVTAAATIGIGGDPGIADEDPFAKKVIHAGKPLIFGKGGADFAPTELPLHQAQKMVVGLGVPLSLFGQSFGALVFGYRDEYPVTSRDTLLALTLARHAAVAINNARLHSELEARSNELADRSTELQQAYRDLQDVTLQKERFFTSISHELRTPLNGILGYQNLLLEGVAGEFPDAARAYVRKANRSANGLLNLINEILDFSKLDAGKLELNLKASRIEEIVEDAISAVGPLIEQKELELTTSLDTPDGPLHTDPDRVRQILINLLSNAIKFTGEGGRLALEVVADSSDGGSGGTVSVRVRDSGPGIPAADRERIFEEFEQVGGTIGGTGLGLPISRKLARLLGGDLTVDSRLGTGSTFILELPRFVEAPVDGFSTTAA